VLGANDGIVSTAGLALGVAAVTTAREAILTAGVAGLVAGAVSMALGEYLSVSAQRDALRAHLDFGAGVDPAGSSNPWQAALSSAASFTIGSAIPLLAILLPPAGIRLPVGFIAVLLALGLTGTASTFLGGAPMARGIVRVLVGGALAMLVTYGIGELVGMRV
jgi:VIT1/CCC1 family predicted Fe2+/Mn2+ transporter